MGSKEDAWLDFLHMSLTIFMNASMWTSVVVCSSFTAISARSLSLIWHSFFKAGTFWCFELLY